MYIKHHSVIFLIWFLRRQEVHLADYLKKYKKNRR